jgi:D-alanyl-lipoteichoic acid acyltransferase DltB (MBOAT superfamily)
MLFNSTHFVIFFPIVVLIYFATPQRFRWALLLFASYYFYMAWKPAYALLILTSTLIDYAAAQKISRSKSKTARRGWLMMSLLTNFGLLFSFKYYNFFSASVEWLSSLFPLPIALPRTDWLLPVGISFYTFQTVSYTIEVYRGKWKAEKHLGYFALYVSFFPQLVAGPIERPGNLLPQFKHKHYFEYDRIVNGLKLIAWGMFKKVVIADRLAVVVDSVYNDPSSFAGPAFVLATICFAIQIYCDFSGYSDIAIGAARILGVKLMRNFDQPYLANSIPDFWRRWHISLSTWFRDYVYIPLGGNRLSVPRWRINLLIVFLISGLWHGANWTFVIWGGVHGILFVFHGLTKPLRQRIVISLRLDRMPRIHQTIRIVMTFLLVTFAWIFFRSNSLSDAYYIVGHLTKGWSALLNYSEISNLTHAVLGIPGFKIGSVVMVSWAAIIIAMFLVEHSEEPLRMFRGWSSKVRWLVYWVLLLTILVFGSFDQSAFIYFQF